MNIGFAGVACPRGVVDENREPPPVVCVGVEPAAFPVLAPKRLEPDVPAPPNRPPPVVVGAVVPALGVLEVLPKRVDEAGLLAEPNRPPEAAPEGAAAVPAPPNSEGPDEGVVVVPAAAPKRDPAGFCALLLFEPRPPKRPPPLD